MGKLLIIKTGITYESVIRKYGDCDRLITNQIGIPYNDVIVVPVYENAEPILTEEVSSIIITGADAMVTDFEPWSISTAKWLGEMVIKNIPILGICYGHQLLAQALDGVVDYHSKGKEYGEVKIYLTSEGKKDPLLKVLPSSFTGYVAHAQTITKLPPKARTLAKNGFESSHAVYFGGKAWGVQFHPEFNADIAKIHVEEERLQLAKEGFNVEELCSAIQDNPYGKILLKSFLELS